MRVAEALRGEGTGYVPSGTSWWQRQTVYSLQYIIRAFGQLSCVKRVKG